MSKRTLKRVGAGSTVGAIAGAVTMVLGLVPASALALEGGTRAAPEPACTPGAGSLFNIPLEPQPSVQKGAPYSGVGTTEVVNTLADGNRITRTNTMRYFRDSAGRVRTEYQLGAIGPFVPEEAQSIVTITDPVAGRRYVLHPSLKRADVFKLSPTGTATAATNGAIFMGGAFTSVGPQGAGTGRASLAPSLSLSPPKPGARISLPSARGSDRTPKMMGPPIGGAPMNGAPMNLAEPMGGRATDGAPPPGAAPTFDVLVTQPGPGASLCKSGADLKAAEPVSIGERNIEGLKVTGSRLEFTIEAGKVGNEQPITVRTDQWFSPDLGVVVSSTHRDPMIGESSYRLEQINRVEPDEALFVVPADYAKNPVGF
jgi:hypothetical protein